MGLLTVVHVKTHSQIKDLVEEVKFLTSKQDQPPDPKRKFTRFKFQLPLTITLADPSSADKRVDASMFNISVEGLCFTSPCRFESGQKIAVLIETEYKHYKVSAAVIHSARFLAIYKTGVRFEMEGD